MRSRTDKILLIDDNQDNLTILKALIQEAFPAMVVLTALSGREGLRIAAQEIPSVILLDIIMPNMDGFAVCRILKADDELSDIPVVFVTAIKDNKENRIRALECGAEAFLSKPIDESELTAQIRAMLKIRDASLQKQSEKERLEMLVREKTTKLTKENAARRKSEHALLEAQKLAHIGSFEHDVASDTITCSAEALSICGLTRKTFSDKVSELISLIHPDDRDMVHTISQQAYQERREAEFTFRLQRPDGDERIVRLRLDPVFDAGSKHLRNVGIIQDITQQRKVEAALNYERDLAKMYLETANIIFMVIDNQGDVDIINQNGCAILGMDSQRIIGMNWFDTFIRESDRDSVKKVFQSLLSGQTANAEFFENTVVTATGEERIIAWHNSPIRNEAGQINGILCAGNDITEERNFQTKLIYLSFHDQLTDLYNRRYFDMELPKLDVPENLPLSVIMTDINGLKVINDSFGHSMGDRLLQRAARVLQSSCREGDILCRLGGDEFVMIMPKTSAEETVAIANTLKDLSAREKIANIEMSISYGYGTKTTKSESITDVLANAENYMYRHKLYERSSMRSKTIDIIMNTLFEKSQRESLHSARVSALCGSIATKMEFSKSKIDQIRTAGLLHDIGKISIDEKILNKESSLTPEERLIIQTHPESSWRILSSSTEFSELAQFVLDHHERWDGSGYPNRLKGDEIPIEARIISIADSYDAMTSERPYKKAMKKQEAARELQNCSGKQFDPAIVDIFVHQVLSGKAAKPAP